MPHSQSQSPHAHVIVISGGTDGMGRALALARAERGDQIVALGSNPVKGRRLRLFIRVAAKFAARSVEQAIAPVHEFIDSPPAAPLTAIDRGTSLPLTLKTLDPANARRLADATKSLLDTVPPE